uniref:Uncharacterized protein n=1 Tax=Rhizophora mucronata TaxID=61149 RepID=A0A2P2LSC1_RHIMU
MRTEIGVGTHFVRATMKNPRNTVSSRTGARMPVMATKQAVLVLDDPISGRSRTRASVSLCEVSPFNADMATPVNAIASRAPKRPIPAHKIHPFCRLKGSLKS